MLPSDDQPKTHEIGRRSYVVAKVDAVDADGIHTVMVGTVLWLVGFLLLLPFWGRLREDGHLWWLWTCLAGFGLGLAGWDYCRRRAHALDATVDPAPAQVGRSAGSPVGRAASEASVSTPEPTPAAQPVAGPPQRPPFRRG